MPAQTPHGIPYPLPTEPVAEGAQAMRNLAEWIDANLGHYRGRLLPANFPPASPHDGDIADLVFDDPNAIVWRFRYNGASASAYKWECIGGTPATLYDSTNRSGGMTANTWNTFAGDPSLVIPRPGDYDTEILATCYGSAGATVWLGILTQSGGPGNPTIDAESGGGFMSAASVRVNLKHKRRFAGLPAACSLTARYQTNAALTLNRFGLSLSAIPVRIS